MSTFLWVVLATIYITAFFMLGVATLRKGHYVLFFVGIIFPILWIIGALMGPTSEATARAHGVV
jgi:Na+/phosphate symporter